MVNDTTKRTPHATPAKPLPGHIDNFEDFAPEGHTATHARVEALARRTTAAMLVLAEVHADVYRLLTEIQDARE